MLHKISKVEYHPLGVVGAIVSWNYPFHNIFNPMLAAVFSGNGVVIKVNMVIGFMKWMYLLNLTFSPYGEVKHTAFVYYNGFRFLNMQVGLVVSI